eukprot:4127317-Pyramimonas_sp.AAC.1
MKATCRNGRGPNCQMLINAEGRTAQAEADCVKWLALGQAVGYDEHQAASVSLRRDKYKMKVRAKTASGASGSGGPA